MKNHRQVKRGAEEAKKRISAKRRSKKQRKGRRVREEKKCQLINLFSIRTQSWCNVVKARPPLTVVLAAPHPLSSIFQLTTFHFILVLRPRAARVATRRSTFEMWSSVNGRWEFINKYQVTTTWDYFTENDEQDESFFRDWERLQKNLQFLAISCHYTVAHHFRLFCSRCFLMSTKRKRAMLSFYLMWISRFSRPPE